MIWIYRLLIAALLVYVFVVVVAFAMQRKMMYFPPTHYDPPPPAFMEVRTPDGSLGWHLPAMDGKPTVMVFHGNASAIDSNMHIFRDLRENGYGIWSVGYPGYPGNAGKPTQLGIVSAAVSQYDALRGTGADVIAFYGTSLGSAVASQLAAKRTPDLLILDAPFNAMSDMARSQMPFLPTGLLLKDKWKSDRAITNLRTPLIWIHGTADRIIPLAQGQKLYDGYEGPKAAHIITGAHHTNTWLRGGRELTLDALSKL